MFGLGSHFDLFPVVAPLPELLGKSFLNVAVHNIIKEPSWGGFLLPLPSSARRSCVSPHTACLSTKLPYNRFNMRQGRKRGGREGGEERSRGSHCLLCLYWSECWTFSRSFFFSQFLIHILPWKVSICFVPLLSWSILTFMLSGGWEIPWERGRLLSKTSLIWPWRCYSLS